MRLVRGIVNGVLMVTLVRPAVRFTVARWRKRARSSAPDAISAPMQQLFEAALIEELAPPIVEPELSTDSLDVTVGRSRLRTVLIAGLVISLVATSALAIATVIRRRREARAAQAKPKAWVAVPVGAPSEEPQEATEPIA